MSDPQSPLRLDGRTALITGASRGIGLAIAEAFLRQGANVCITARRQHELDAARVELDAISAALPGSGAAMDVAGSAGDPAHAGACVAATLERFGRLDILVNNAATSPAFGPLAEVELAAWRKTFEVNVEGPLLFAQQAWRHWMRVNGGVILNVTTVGVHHHAPFIGTYEASKATLHWLTRQLAGEFAPGVRVVSLSPGVVKTRMSRVLWENGEGALTRTIPLGRIGMPVDIAGAALFLVSDLASWATGIDLVVDGGSLVGGAHIDSAAGNPMVDNLRRG
ncbi:MAG: 3-alpha-hydroxycholanate dehydrogenase (NADP(+)) [Pseudomonadales bacterium]|nr:3-alpha-hydroxycholanate dehydrogenase (NADP(+)) [Pseudomonadales bacterium]